MSNFSNGIGYGGDFWGGGPWGGTGISFGPFGPSSPLTCEAAIAVVENVVRLEFNIPPFWSGLLESDDASSGSHYSVTPVAGTIGGDGQPTRPVGVLFAQVGPDPASLDVFLDRPMSPWPAQYVIEVFGLSDQTRAEMSPDPQFLQFYGLFKMLVPPLSDAASAPVRDVANPQTQQGLNDPLPVTSNPLALGTFGVDDTGDYAFDDGLVSLKKRIYRRLITRKGGFAWAPLYGVGIPSYGKRLASPALRTQLAADAQQQILQEPEVQSCVVTSITPKGLPGLVYFIVQVQTHTGQSTKFAVPFQI